MFFSFILLKQGARIAPIPLKRGEDWSVTNKARRTPRLVR